MSSQHVDRWIATIDGTSDDDADKLGVAALVYAALFLVEGIGLLARKVWAEWLTLGITASFIPIEIYELVHHASALKAITLALNIAIVVYLVFKLRKQRAEDREARAKKSGAARERDQRSSGSTHLRPRTGTT